jgi:hypothetical protein
MKSLSHHFMEMTSHIKIPHQLIDYAYLKISELSKIELKKILQDGGKLVNEDDLIKCVDEIKEFTLMDKIYKVCVREIKNGKNNQIYHIINFYSPSIECVILQMELSEKKAHLTELLKQEGCMMRQKSNKTNKYENIPKETGELLVEIVIKICRKYKIDELTLTDNSYILCENNPNSRINLLYSKMILDGDTWYGKFGFEPKEDCDKKTYLSNKENFNKVLTSSIKKEKFICEIIDREKNNLNIKKIFSQYEIMKNEKLNVFMKWISINYCEIYSEIYEYIYRKAGYKKYTSLEFVLKFNTDLTEFVKMVKSHKI